MPDAKVVDRTPTLVVATWKNVAMLLLNGPPEPDTVARLGTLIGEVHRDTGLGVGLIHVVRTETVKPPSEETRRVYRDLMRDPYMPLLASAVVIESAAAFTSAFVSSIITGLELVTRPSFPTRMFSRVGDGARWLSGELVKRGSAFGTGEDLVEVFERTCADPI